MIIPQFQRKRQNHQACGSSWTLIVRTEEKILGSLLWKTFWQLLPNWNTYMPPAPARRMQAYPNASVRPATAASFTTTPARERAGRPAAAQSTNTPQSAHTVESYAARKRDGVSMQRHGRISRPQMLKAGPERRRTVGSVHIKFMREAFLYKGKVPLRR